MIVNGVCVELYSFGFVLMDFFFITQLVFDSVNVQGNNLYNSSKSY